VTLVRNKKKKLWSSGGGGGGVVPRVPYHYRDVRVSSKGTGGGEVSDGSLRNFETALPFLHLSSVGCFWKKQKKTKRG